MNNNLISIVVPIYNSEKYLEKQLQSIENQTITDYEVLLINDGSVDNSEKICKAFIKNKENWKYYLKSNTGVSDTRNFGINLSKGKYICFIDSDDCLHGQYLENLLKQMNCKGNQLACCGYKKIKNESMINEENNSEYEELVFENEKKFEILFSNIGGYLWNKLFIRDIIVSYNIRFDENISMSEDMLFIFRYLEHINKVTFNNNVYYYYRISDSNSSKKRNSKWFSIFEVYDYILKNKELYSTKLLNEIMYRYEFYLYMGKYKARIIKNQTVYKNNIKNRIKINKSIRKNYTRKQKTKLFFYKYFNYIACYLETKKEKKV